MFRLPDYDVTVWLYYTKFGGKTCRENFIKYRYSNKEEGYGRKKI